MAEIEADNSTVLNIEEIHDFPFDVDFIQREFARDRFKLKVEKDELSNLRQKQAAVVNEAESIMTSLCNRMSFFAFSNSFAVIALKSSVSCISLLLSLTISALLLSTLVCPVYLAFLRMMAVLIDFIELANEQQNLIDALESPSNLAKMMNLDNSPIRASATCESHFNEVKSVTKRVKSMKTSLYGSIYLGCFFSVCVSLILYVGTVFWTAKWEECENPAAWSPASSPPVLDIIKSFLPLVM